ncbi:putative serine incorporator [Trichoplax sp. H2]|nr:putative serine incorporator [Trichoplax sp. H2]|eukprot:RDD36888.1 putative serine incorporator [Trichoplax sp. H2]
MGAICSLAGCAASLACCCGSAACSLCCSSCPSCKNSTSSRVMYTVVLMLCLIISCIVLAPGLQGTLEKIPGFCSHLTDCNKLVGYLAVYRVCFAFALFYLLMCVLMINVKNSRDSRSSIQNGFWAVKFLIIGGVLIGAFFIPRGSFSQVWMIFGLGGAFLFIIIQLIIMVDFAHSWNESWYRIDMTLLCLLDILLIGIDRENCIDVAFHMTKTLILDIYRVGKAEETDNKIWFYGLLFFTVAMYCATITATVLFYVFFTKPDGCGLNKFFVSFNLIACIIISIIAILPKVQEVQPRSGLLQSAVISLYTTYLTWSAMSNEPDAKCNPQGVTLEGGKLTPHADFQTVIGIIVLFVMVIYSSVRNSSATSVGRFSLSSNKEETTAIPEPSSAPSGDEESGRPGQKVWDNEQDAVAYSYSFYHFMLALATFYIMMQLTNWYSPESASIVSLSSNWSSVWVKIASSWVCMLLYIWTLVAPLILPNRDFS